MDYQFGTELLIQSLGNIWTPAIVEEDDGDEIFITYKSNGANEWINKDSHRIKPMNVNWINKLTEIPSSSENMVIDVKSIVQDVPFTEKEIPKKSNNARSSSIFKVKFKKDDFLTKKSQESKLKEQKIIKESKKSTDRESKQLLLNNPSNNEKISTNTLLDNQHFVENVEVKSETSVEIVESSKHLNKTNLLRSENFEESLEDIEAEAEICSPTKSSISHGDIKQKKKRKTFFGLRRRPEKRRKSSSKNKESKKNVLVVKLNPLKLKKKDTTLPHILSNTNDAITSPPSKKSKASSPANSLSDMSSHQNSFPQLANNTLLQKIRMDALKEQGLRCPKQECRKLFRKENLLMMHIKHYHSEYTELLMSTPNVTDLATARIEGENVDELSPSYFLHRISQIEAKKSWGQTSYDSSSPSTSFLSLKFNEQEHESNNSLQSEIYNTSFTSIDKPNDITQPHDSKDSGFSGIVESVDSITETPIKESAQIKEPIEKITIVDVFENKAKENCNAESVAVSDRHYKIKKNKSDIESLPKEEVINCSCGSNQEDGLMIQCDVCLCWQHGYCNKIDSEDQVPDNYICISCLNPSKKRRSKQYHYSQEWIKEGKIASVLQHKDERRKKDENLLKQSHNLVSEMIQHINYLNSLLVKTVIYGQTPDHPKLYLWSEQNSKKNDEHQPNKLEELLSGPVPEKPINTAECRKNLLEEIDVGFNNLKSRIDLFDSKTDELEDEVNGTVDDEVLSNTMTLLIHDLKTICNRMSNKETDNV